jgi:hypothetical protein
VLTKRMAERREIEQVRETDLDTRTVARHRTVDSLARLLWSRAITEPMYDAGRAFQRDFQFAGLDPIRARLMMLPVGREATDLTEAQLDARRRVHKALRALGGIGGPAGSCLWHGVGLQRSIREWALRQGWGGRPVRQEQAQGILVAALGMLAAHLGYDEARRAS